MMKPASETPKVCPVDGKVKSLWNMWMIYVSNKDDKDVSLNS